MRGRQRLVHSRRRVARDRRRRHGSLGFHTGDVVAEPRHRRSSFGSARIFPLTGDLSSVGPSINASTQLAVDTINQTLAKMGLSSSISVDLVDTQDDQTATQPAIEAATKEVKVDKADVIIGTMSSTSTIAMAQAVTIPNDVVVISPTASSPQITDLKDNNTVWRILPSDDFQGKALVAAAATAFGPARDDQRRRPQRRLRQRAPGDLRQDVEGRRRQDRPGGQLGPDRGDLRHRGSEAHLGEPERLGDHRLSRRRSRRSARRSIRTGKWSPAKTLMTDVMSIPASLKQVGQQATVGLRGTAPAALGDERPAGGGVLKLFKAKESKFPVTGYEGTSFDAVMLAFLAALQGHSASPNAIKANLRSVSGPPGVEGHLPPARRRRSGSSSPASRSTTRASSARSTTTATAMSAPRSSRSGSTTARRSRRSRPSRTASRALRHAT